KPRESFHKSIGGICGQVFSNLKRYGQVSIFAILQGLSEVRRNKPFRRNHKEVTVNVLSIDSPDVIDSKLTKNRQPSPHPATNIDNSFRLDEIKNQRHNFARRG